MPETNISAYPSGFNHGVSIRNLPIVNVHGGRVHWVDFATGFDGSGGAGTFQRPFKTLDYAIGMCRANKGDTIMLYPNHAETITAAAGITADIAGVTIIGVGTGTDRAEFTFGTSTAASILISAANVSIINVVGLSGIDALTKPFDIQASDAYLDIEWRDTTSLIEAARAVLTNASADRLYVKLRYLGQTGGNATVNAIRLVGTDGGRIELDAYGIFSTAAVEFLTTASTNIEVSGYVYNSGTTDGSKLVVDTQGSSTWYARIYDGAAGLLYSGGSGLALVSSDLAAISSALYGTAGIASFPTGVAAANAVSMAEVLRFAQENIIVGSGTALPSNTSLYGVLAGATGVTTYPAAAAPASGVSLAEVIRAIYDRQVGDGTDAAVNSVLGKRVNKTTADVITGAAVTLFTVSVGRVMLTGLVGKVTTIIGAGTNNAKFQFNPTTGTTVDICANLDIDADEAGALYSVDGTPATAMLRSESGAVRNMQNQGIILDVGTIEFITGSDATGSISFQAWYVALDDGALLA